MNTGTELLAQAHTLQSLEHAATEQVFQQKLHPDSQQQRLDQADVDVAFEATHSTPTCEPAQTQAAQPVQSQLPDRQTADEVALARQQRVAAAQQDMMSVALDIVESQLPLLSSKPALDWSAQQHLNKYQSQVVLYFSVMGFDFAVMPFCAVLFA